MRTRGTWVSILTTPIDQPYTSHHYFKDANSAVCYDFGNCHYTWPAECDLMAQLARMRLDDRFSGWDRTAFTAEGDSHVSICCKN